MSRNSKLSAPIPKYCKVCHDANKTEAEYRSHFTRETHDPTSRVICPTLLALECRFCYKKGHTVKYCSVLKEKNKPTKMRQRETQKAIEKPEGKPNNMFDCLGSDSEEEAVKQILIPIAPTLSSINTKVTTSYASVLTKPVTQSDAKIQQIKPAPWTVATEPPIRRPMRSWADWSDSDEEEEENITCYKNAEHAQQVAAEYDSDW